MFNIIINDYIFYYLKMVSKSEEGLIKLIKAKKPKLQDIISLLRNNHIEINALDSHGYNPLHYAIKQEQPDIVNLLLTIESEDEQNPIEKSDPNITTNDYSNSIITSPLLLALIYVNDTEKSNKIIKMLLKSGAKCDYKDEENCTFFLRACEKGRTEIINYILEKDPCPIELNKEVSNFGGALHMALLGSQDDLITPLLQKGIDLTIKNSDGNTALHLALLEKQMNQFKEILDFIVASDMDNSKKKEIINAQNNEGNTLLHELALSKSNFLINYLINKIPKEFAADETIKNKEGFDYKEAGENMIKIQQQREEDEKKRKEEIRKLKEEAKKEAMEEERKAKERERQYREQMEKQEEFGRKLIQYRGWIFFIVFCLFMGITFILVSHATKKKEKII